MKLSIKNNRIFQSFKSIKKAQEGVYVDSSLNRKLGRVGMPYLKNNNILSSFKDASDKVKDVNEKSSYYKQRKQELIDFSKKIGISEDGLKYVDKFNENIYISNDDKLFVVSPVYLSTKDSDFANVGNFYENLEELDKTYNKIFGNDYIEKRRKLLNEENNIKFLDDISLKRLFPKIYDILLKKSEIEDKNIKLNKDFQEAIFDFIINSKRNDFYNGLFSIGSKADQETVDVFIQNFIKIRFINKYNKVINFKINQKRITEKNTIELNKKDLKDKFNILNQLEYCINDVLKDKKLFIDNKNINKIDIEDNSGYSCYNYSSKSLHFSKEHFIAEYGDTLTNKLNQSTTYKEKFFVSTLLHEIGHSLQYDKNFDKNNNFSKFAEILGYNKNKDISIFGDVLKNHEDYKKIEGIVYFSRVEKDNFQNTKDFVKNESLTLEDFSNSYLLSNYSDKSATEAFAEYFSFYKGNKKEIDKLLSKIDNIEYAAKNNTLFELASKYRKKGSASNQLDLSGKNLLDKVRIAKFNIKLLKCIKKIVEDI